MNDSILLTVKKMLGIAADYEAFDTDVIVFINSALMVINQLGVGSALHITGSSEVWSDFLGDNTGLESVKELVYLRVKKMFDPPSSSSVLTEIGNQINELEWRLNVLVDPGEKK